MENGFDVHTFPFQRTAEFQLYRAGRTEICKPAHTPLRQRRDHVGGEFLFPDLRIGPIIPAIFVL